MTSERTGAVDAGREAGELPLDGTVETPFFLYVHYLTDEHADRYPLYLFQIEESADPQASLRGSIDDIMDGKAKEVPRERDGTQHWRALSYVAFVLNGGPTITGVTFDERPQHHSFDKAGSMPRYRDCSAVYFINKRMNRGRRRLRAGESEVVRWVVHHRGIVNHESSTPNTGP